MHTVHQCKRLRHILQLSYQPQPIKYGVTLPSFQKGKLRHGVLKDKHYMESAGQRRSGDLHSGLLDPGVLITSPFGGSEQGGEGQTMSRGR